MPRKADAGRRQILVGRDRRRQIREDCGHRVSLGDVYADVFRSGEVGALHAKLDGCVLRCYAGCVQIGCACKRRLQRGAGGAARSGQVAQ